MSRCMELLRKKSGCLGLLQTSRRVKTVCVIFLLYSLCLSLLSVIFFNHDPQNWQKNPPSRSIEPLKKLSLIFLYSIYYHVMGFTQRRRHLKTSWDTWDRQPVLFLLRNCQHWSKQALWGVTLSADAMLIGPGVFIYGSARRLYLLPAWVRAATCPRVSRIISFYDTSSHKRGHKESIMKQMLAC